MPSSADFPPPNSASFSASQRLRVKEPLPPTPEAEAVQRAFHQPILIRENPPVDLTPRRTPTPAPSATNWSDALESSLARLETSRANSVPEPPPSDPAELIGIPSTGLRRLAALGRPATPRLRELPTSPAPAPQPADLHEEFAGILRREALRHGILPEEWEQ